MYIVSRSGIRELDIVSSDKEKRLSPHKQNNHQAGSEVGVQ